ncbi:MAG: DNA repair protein RecN [Candidatus Latescibacteria bacterium ADurb.Bin168]|nr:MAG: DNA repair protein RecN [Candidatus Latescibacteria bacterium ADurb.Bin168]
MLEELSVQDFALIERVSLTFSPRFNVITGETGAGKSILVGALGSLLGMRTGAEMVRFGCEKATIEARFRLNRESAVRDLVLDFGGEIEDDTVVIRRLLGSDGRTRVWIGDVSVSLKTLRDVASRLVDFHGQHDHQLLLSPAEHCAILDSFAGTQPLVALLREKLSKLKQLREQRATLLERQTQSAALRDSEEFERRELDEINPVPDEFESLTAEQRVLENVERLGTLLASVCNLLSESDDSVTNRLGQARKWVQEVSSIDERLAEEISGDYEALETLAQEISARCAARVESLEADPGRLDYVSNRLAQLRRLIKRYGSVENAVARRKELELKVDADADTAEAIDRLGEEIRCAHGEMADLALELSRKRAGAARRLADEVSASLASLGMERARFEAGMVPLSADGVDCLTSDAIQYDGHARNVGDSGAEEVEFLIAPNPGEPLKPLARIASGGEISRVMLAIKSVLAEHDPVSSMVFDEIDAGISGRIGDAVGERMRVLAEHRQIIAITHLPQIAARADHHIVVEKEEARGRTLTRARAAEGEERVLVLAELLGGGEARSTAIEHARAILNGSEDPGATR